MVAFSLTVVDFADEILTLKFLSQNDLDAFKNASGASDILRKAIFEVLGVQVKFKAQIEPAAAPQPVAPAPAAAATAPAQAAPAAAFAQDEPADEYEPEPEDDEAPAPAAPQVSAAPQAAAKSRNSMVDESARYGESLLREMLGAEPIADKNAGK
jgi:hypothetical protein